MTQKEENEAQRVGGTTMLMFHGVKLEDPSVSAFRRELLTRWRDRDRRRRLEGATTTTTATRTSPRATATPAPVATTVFRALRPGDRIVKPPSLTTTMPTSTTPTPLTSPHGPEPLPVAEIFARRQRVIAAARPWATKES